MVSGDVVGLAALAIAALTVYLTVMPCRRELQACKRDRLELRRNLQIVVSALLTTLPVGERVGLLQRLDEWAAPESE